MPTSPRSYAAVASSAIEKTQSTVDKPMPSVDKTSSLPSPPPSSSSSTSASTSTSKEASPDPTTPTETKSNELNFLPSSSPKSSAKSPPKVALDWDNAYKPMAPSGPVQTGPKYANGKVFKPRRQTQTSASSGETRRDKTTRAATETDSKNTTITLAFNDSGPKPPSTHEKSHTTEKSKTMSLDKATKPNEPKYETSGQTKASAIGKMDTSNKNVVTQFGIKTSTNTFNGFLNENKHETDTETPKALPEAIVACAEPSNKNGGVGSNSVANDPRQKSSTTSQASKPSEKGDEKETAATTSSRGSHNDKKKKKKQVPAPIQTSTSKENASAAGLGKSRIGSPGTPSTSKSSPTAEVWSLNNHSRVSSATTTLSSLPPEATKSELPAVTEVDNTKTKAQVKAQAKAARKKANRRARKQAAKDANGNTSAIVKQDKTFIKNAEVSTLCFIKRKEDTAPVAVNLADGESQTEQPGKHAKSNKKKRLQRAAKKKEERKAAELDPVWKDLKDEVEAAHVSSAEIQKPSKPASFSKEASEYEFTFVHNGSTENQKKTYPTDTTQQGTTPVSTDTSTNECSRTEDSVDSADTLINDSAVAPVDTADVSNVADHTLPAVENAGSVESQRLSLQNQTPEAANQQNLNQENLPNLDDYDDEPFDWADDPVDSKPVLKSSRSATPSSPKSPSAAESAVTTEKQEPVPAEMSSDADKIENDYVQPTTPIPAPEAPIPAVLSDSEHHQEQIHANAATSPATEAKASISSQPLDEDPPHASPPFSEFDVHDFFEIPTLSPSERPAREYRKASKLNKEYPNRCASPDIIPAAELSKACTDSLSNEHASETSAQEVTTESSGSTSGLNATKAEEPNEDEPRLEHDNEQDKHEESAGSDTNSCVQSDGENEQGESKEDNDADNSTEIEKSADKTPSATPTAEENNESVVEKLPKEESEEHSAPIEVSADNTLHDEPLNENAEVIKNQVNMPIVQDLGNGIIEYNGELFMRVPPAMVEKMYYNLHNRCG